LSSCSDNPTFNKKIKNKPERLTCSSIYKMDTKERKRVCNSKTKFKGKKGNVGFWCSLACQRCGGPSTPSGFPPTAPTIGDKECEKLCGNVAKNGFITVSSEVKGRWKKFLTDGNKKTRWESRHSEDMYITMDFGKQVDINRIDLDWYGSLRAQRYQMYFWDDKHPVKEQWVSVYQVKNNKERKQSIMFPNVTTKFVQIRAPRRTVGQQIGKGFSLKELRVHDGQCYCRRCNKCLAYDK